jgi:hypothetical protein
VSYLFVFRSYPDIDHMLPLAWKLAERGQQVHAVISPGYDPGTDHRLAFATQVSNLHVHRLDSGYRMETLWRTSLPYAMGFMLRHRVRVVAVEWGAGLPVGYDRLASAAGLVAVARSLVRSVRHRGEAQQVRVNHIVAARLLRRARLCLPHGLSIKLDRVSSSADIGVDIDWSDRNRFTVYVMNTDHHRRWFLEHANGDPDVVQTWGSLRWSPEWFAINRDLAPDVEWPAPDGAARVVFMLPKWHNRVYRERVVGLVKRLQALDFVSLALKSHPRPAEGSADPLRADPEVDFGRILDFSTKDSVGLIRAADAVIDVGSSIGIETVMQHRALINPTYVHELTTLFDDIPGSAVVANDADKVIDSLRACAAGDPPLATPEAYDELMRRAVFGSRDAPYDVMDHYYRQVRALTGAPD